MIRFLDGPAAGAPLMLRRAPVLLRVVIGPRGRIDALDQTGDVAEAGETIHLYFAVGKPNWMHMRAGKGMGGRWAMAEYRLLPDPPADDVLRDNARYGAWCEENRARLCPEWAQ